MGTVVIVGIACAAAGFIIGILVGRHNKPLVDSAVAKVQEDADALKAKLNK